MILFLDFDGVLHPLNRASGTLVFVSEFEFVMRDFPDVDIVISSAWREAHGLDELRAFFSPNFRQRIIDVTPVFHHLDHQYLRHAEILTWLRDVGREYESWIAIDDSEWLFPPRCPNLILVDTDRGFDTIAETLLRQRLARHSISPERTSGASK